MGNPPADAAVTADAEVTAGAEVTADAEVTTAQACSLPSFPSAGLPVGVLADPKG